MKVIDLFLNYRSLPEIVSLANRIIGQSTREYGKPQQAVRESNGQDAVMVQEYPTMDDAVVCVCDEINQGIIAGQPPGTFAVLGRTHAVLHPFVGTLRFLGVPVATQSTGRDGDLWKKPAARKLLRALRLVTNPHDMLAALAIYGARIGPDGVERARSYRTANDSSWVAAIRHVDESLCGWSKRMPADNPKLIDCVSVMSDYSGELDEAFGDEAEKALDEWMRAQGQDWWSATVSDLLDWVSARQIEVASQDELRDDAVNVFTVHGYKGLERPTVYVVGCTDTLFPHKRSHGDAENVEEELRLLFVAVTRAQDKLVLVWWRQEKSFSGKPVETHRSRFLEGVI